MLAGGFNQFRPGKIELCQPVAQINSISAGLNQVV